VAKTTVNRDSEIVQSLLQGDLTCLQSVVKDLNEHALEAKGKTGIEEKGLSETASQHGSTRGRGDEDVTVSEFVAVLGID